MKVFNSLFKTTRYFIVYYIASHPKGRLTGQSCIAITGYKPFLNKEQVEKRLQDRNPEGFDFVVTGFNELKKFEFEEWISVDYK